MPSIEYCSTILFMCNEQELRTLQVLQNKVLRAVLKKNRYESVTSMLNDLDLYSVKQRIAYNTVKLIYKAEYNKLPKYLCEMFSNVSPNQPYNLRNNDELRPQCLTSFEQKLVL